MKVTDCAKAIEVLGVSTQQDHNYINVAAEIMSGKWTLPVIAVLQQDTLRYSTVQRAVPGITERALTLTLQKLERNGVVIRTSHPTIPPQVEYKLTPLGLGLLELSEMMIDWAKKHATNIKRSQTAYDRSVSR